MFCSDVFTYAVDQNPYGEVQVVMVLQAENQGLGWSAGSQSSVGGSEEPFTSALQSCVLHVLVAGVRLK